MTIQFKQKTGSRGIEWCDETRNPFGGCEHDCKWEMPDGTVAECYAKALAENGVAAAGYPHGFEYHYWRPSSLKSLTRGKEPRLIFMDSMSDVFGHWVPENQLLQVLQTMGKAPQHTYQGLTKAPGRIRRFVDYLPPNLWSGVSSAPDWMNGKRLNGRQQEAYTRSALSVLADVKGQMGNIVWMSLEPLSWDMAHLFVNHPLDWVVIGAATNGRKKYQPNPEHVARLLEVFDATGTAVFFKGNIRPLFDENPWLGRWREDFPTHYRDGSAIPAVMRREDEAAAHGWALNAEWETAVMLTASGAQMALL
ncbi:MAG: DUF5131 family protein [Chloroflexi bacterium]|nr:DUF5131 family protein [Chloroflexota bacterium]